MLKGMTTTLGAVIGPIKTAIVGLVTKLGGWKALGLLGVKGLLLGAALVATPISYCRSNRRCS